MENPCPYQKAKAPRRDPSISLQCFDLKEFSFAIDAKKEQLLLWRERREADDIRERF